MAKFLLYKKIIPNLHQKQTIKSHCNPSACLILFLAPVNGNWGRWAAWDACDKSCGYGKQKRKRTCSDPAPKFGGKTCPEADTQYRMCNMMACLDSRWRFCTFPCFKSSVIRRKENLCKLSPERELKAPLKTTTVLE